MRETGGIVTGWLGQLVVIMAVLAFVGYEAVATGLNAVTVEDAAQEIARAAARAYAEAGRDRSAAADAAQQEAADRGAELVEFNIAEQTVTVVVRRTADTVVLDDIGWFDSLTTRTATWQRPLQL
ncbi:MAG: hypothetical protein M3N57_12415 [Actinomycetota bacterium]|nr:hypothetical protein [Actinomycetota bacterium]